MRTSVIQTVRTLAFRTTDNTSLETLIDRNKRSLDWEVFVRLKTAKERTYLAVLLETFGTLTTAAHVVATLWRSTRRLPFHTDTRLKSVRVLGSRIFDRFLTDFQVCVFAAVCIIFMS